MQRNETFKVTSLESPSSSLRIAIDLTPLQPGGKNGGAKILTLTLLQQLQKVSPRSYFLLLTAAWNHDELCQYENQQVQCYQVADWPLRKYLEERQYISLLWQQLPRKVKAKLFGTSVLQSRDIDLLFCPFTSTERREKNIPTVSIFYDFQHLEYPEFFSQQEKSHRTQFLEKAVEESDAIACISDFTRQSLFKHFNPSQKQVSVVPIAIHQRWSGLSEQAVKQQLESFNLESVNYAFYPANYWPHKNHRFLLKAYKNYLEQYPDSDLNLVFTGSLETEERVLREEAINMGLCKDIKEVVSSDRVRFLGFLDERQLEAIWRGCKCLVFPSLYEGFGIPLLEAMAFGKPVLANNAASLPEVGGEAALYFDPSNLGEFVQRLAQIESDEILCQNLVQKGHENLKRFEPKVMASQYLEVFVSALNCHKLKRN